MRKKEVPPKEFFDKYLSYDPEAGRFLWKDRSSNLFNAKFAGKPAGCERINRDGTRKRVCIRIENEEYSAHVIALVMSGIGVPMDKVVDHINRDPWDNRLCNLRLATQKQNMSNIRFKKPKSGYIGVVKLPRSNTYEARIKTGQGNASGVLSRAGFKTPEAAAIQRDIWSIKYRGEFAVLNFPRSL